MRKIITYLPGLGMTIFLVIVYPQLVDEGYFRKSPYWLPLFLVIVLLCWLIPLFADHHFHSLLAFIHGKFGVKHPYMTLGAMMVIGGLAGAGLSGTGWALFVRHRKHLEELQGTKQTPSETTTASPGTTVETHWPVDSARVEATHHEREDKATAKVTRPTSTHEKKPTFVEKADRYIVSLGGNTSSIPASGGTIRMLGSGDEWLVRAHVKNGEFVVDAKLFSGSYSDVVLVEENQFSMRQASWDRNFDDTAFEVVNENLMPVLQIIYRTPRIVEIYGLFGVQPLCISPTGIFGPLPVGTPITPENYSVKRIFKYPSRIYQGRELESN